MAVLFTGKWHDSFPRHLVINRDLSPLEKIAWQAIRLSISDPTRPGSTPRRDELAAMINCSTATVTAARTMLRICRWLTYCKTVRKQGRFVGDIYLFHDEPLSLESTLTIDTSYIPFLQSQTQSGNKRLRTFAGNILKEIDGVQGLDIPSELDVMSSRLDSFFGFQPTTISQRKNLSLDNTKPVMGQNTKDMKISNEIRRQGKNFYMAESTDTLELSDRIKNFDTALKNSFETVTTERNFFPLARGSNNNSNINININTAQARGDETENVNKSWVKDNPNPNPDVNPEKTFTLAIQQFPELASLAIKRYVILMFALREHHLPVLHRMLSKLDEPNRTDVLFQLVGRQAAGHHGWTNGRLHNVIAFTGELIKRAKSGEFFPDEWALELKKSVASGEEPWFDDSPERARYIRQAQSGFEESN